MLPQPVLSSPRRKPRHHRSHRYPCSPRNGRFKAYSSSQRSPRPPGRNPQFFSNTHTPRTRSPVGSPRRKAHTNAASFLDIFTPSQYQSRISSRAQSFESIRTLDPLTPTRPARSPRPVRSPFIAFTKKQSPEVTRDHSFKSVFTVIQLTVRHVFLSTPFSGLILQKNMLISFHNNQNDSNRYILFTKFFGKIRKLVLD